MKLLIIAIALSAIFSACTKEMSHEKTCGVVTAAGPNWVTVGNHTDSVNNKQEPTPGIGIILIHAVGTEYCY